MSSYCSTATKSGVNTEGWERADFPILCETCLGDNPFVRMTRADFDKECKVCARPFTVFRWRPGARSRYKKTEICQTCSRLKNVCQTCLLDLQYGLPVQVRDTALKQSDSSLIIPESDVNREYFAQQAERQVALAGGDGGGGLVSGYGKAPTTAVLNKLTRNQPFYKRNRAHICSFFVKGECTRGSDCPYRHEYPVEGELAHQNIKDRYYGVNDPVAQKLLNKADVQLTSVKPPDDNQITTLWIGGVTPVISEEDLRDKFYGFGELSSIRVVHKSNCAFITYTTREAAEKATEKFGNRFNLKGVDMRISWGKPQNLDDHDQKRQGSDADGSTTTSSGYDGYYNYNYNYNYPSNTTDSTTTTTTQAPPRPFYPSMDPSQMGSRNPDYKPTAGESS
eukprot:TRINITY_DN2658_c0_g2_i1.p1 TRINITY_DN2658_c0_g2~~TRINITY_DN2658_c0_g2_i1.p1  ORF type:complete len:421 (-),score=61.16 TRINITY_DN2658_c0_g2_i1:135-1316(-)